LLLITSFSYLILSFSLADRKETELTGKVIGLTASQDYDGHTLYLIVSLKNNNQALIPINQSIRYKKGCNVLIKEIMRDDFLASKQYIFIKYTESNCESTL